MLDSKGGMGIDPASRAATPTPMGLPKLPDLPAVRTQLFYAESKDCEAFFATVTEQWLSRRAAPGQWEVKYRSDG